MSSSLGEPRRPSGVESPLRADLARRRPADGADREEHRFRSVHRAAIAAFGAGPLLGSLGAGLLVLAGSRLGDSLGIGVLILALTWGFLGSIAWITARGIEATEQAVLERRQLRAARSAPDHGQLSLGAESGQVSPPPKPPTKREEPSSNDS